MTTLTCGMFDRRATVLTALWLHEVRLLGCEAVIGPDEYRNAELAGLRAERAKMRPGSARYGWEDHLTVMAEVEYQARRAR